MSSMFDLREWWKAGGREKYSLVYLVVPIIIALDSTNAFQERIFSTCTWFDDPLRQSLKDGRFEMAVLLAANDALISKFDTPTEDQAKDIVAKAIQKLSRVSDDSSPSHFHVGLDADAEDFIE